MTAGQWKCIVAANGLVWTPARLSAATGNYWRLYRIWKNTFSRQVPLRLLILAKGSFIVYNATFFRTVIIKDRIREKLC